MKEFYIYIMASPSGTLYTGVTSNLEKRVYEHKMKQVEGFTKKYDCNRLVYYERVGSAEEAFRMEKRMKKWHRWKKEALIRGMNPGWMDLSAEWYE